MRNIVPILVVFMITTEAQAYIDPGTGSLVLQGIIAVIATVTAGLGIYYRKVKTLFTRKQKIVESVIKDDAVDGE